MADRDATFKLLTKLRDSAPSDKLEAAKELFANLGYEFVNAPLGVTHWSKGAKEALRPKGDPRVLFKSGDFVIAYIPLRDLRTSLDERPVMSQLLRDYPYVLGLFTEPTQSRWHFVNAKWDEAKERRRLFRRITISPEDRLRTASERLMLIETEPGLDVLALKERHDRAFDVEKVTDEFFRDYQTIFETVESDLTRQTNDTNWAHDHALQYLNRLMFIYFIQRKRWLGDDPEFMRALWRAYRGAARPSDTFDSEWLSVLFFQAFNKRFGHPRYMPKAMTDILTQAPYLNGGLFTRNGLDRQYEFAVSDSLFAKVFAFFEHYNFTIREDTPLDQEVAVDPEMMGRVYESLVNMSELSDERAQAGIFYTPRTEIDLMCRLALTDYLANHLPETDKGLLYDLVFAIEQEEKDSSDEAVARAALWPELDRLLRQVTVVDPACGSGSFLIGMLSILSDLGQRANRVLGHHERGYELKRRIIGENLYGVDVMRWAVDVAELRLWLQLAVETELTPAERILEPLLPNLSFKIRQGDSLVQEVGGVDFSLLRHGFIQLDAPLRGKLTRLKGQKLDYYLNPKGTYGEARRTEIEQMEVGVFREILNSQIHAIENQVKRISASLEQKQADIFGEVVQALDASEAARRAARKEELTGRLEVIKKARAALTHAKSVPFVWDIGFAEIFDPDKGGFDIVIGNPPYVRQESIADPQLEKDRDKPENKRAYKAKLQRSVYGAFPRYFGYHFHKDRAARKLNAQSDLYVYFYFHGLSLLNPKGAFCFITSNSWLDVEYGAQLQEFLLRHVSMKFVIDNQVKRSFARADINTVIVLLSSPDDQHDWAIDDTARFVMFKVPFELALEAHLFHRMEAIEGRHTTPDYRINSVSKRKLLEEGRELGWVDDLIEQSRGEVRQPTQPVPYRGNKLGAKYLRMPEFIWPLIDDRRLLPLGKVCELERGKTTGLVDFFILSDEAVARFGIEPVFLKPILTSTDEIESYTLVADRISKWIFHCSLSLRQLGEKGYGGARAYVIWGSRQMTRKKARHTVASIRWPDVPSVRQNRPEWHCLSLKEPGDFIVPRLVRERFFFAENPHGIIDSDMFFHGRFTDRSKNTLGVALLNCSLVYLLMEVFGRHNIEGRFNIYGPDLNPLPIPNLALFSSEAEREAAKQFQTLSKRPILKIREEVSQPDRSALDEIVFDVLRITASVREMVYQALISMVESRLAKARSLR